MGRTVYTKRQMNVVYRAYKEGRFEAEQSDMSFAYRYCFKDPEELFDHGEYLPVIKQVRKDISSLIDAIIEGRESDIQNLFKTFMDSVHNVHGRELDERRRSWQATDARVARVVAGVA